MEEDLEGLGVGGEHDELGDAAVERLGRLVRALRARRRDAPVVRRLARASVYAPARRYIPLGIQNRAAAHSRRKMNNN